VSRPEDIALAIDLGCRGNMHDAGTAIKQAVKAHCDGDYETAALLCAKAVACASEAKKLCVRQAPAAPAPQTAELGLTT